jgi:hypothetical protein
MRRRAYPRGAEAYNGGVRLRPLLAALLVAGLAFTARAAELYGRPLRGLTPVRLAELGKRPAEYDGKTIRVRGDVLSEAGAFLLAEGDARLLVTLRDGTPLPKDVKGASAAAEGVFRAKGPGGSPALEATGVELTR